MAAVRYIGIDPGLIKCGYAVLSGTGERLALEIVPSERLMARVEADVSEEITQCCVGDATRSKAVVRQLRERWPELPIALVDERNTSLEARRLFYEDHPPRGLLRLIPRGLLVPKEPLDGYAALLIIRRYLAASASPGQS